MLNALFEKMLQVSAVLSVAAVLYVLFRPLIRKYFSAAAEYALIALVMLRGLIPFNYALTLPAAPAPVVQEKVPAAVNPMMFTPFKNTDIPPPIVAVPEQEFFSVEKFLSAVAEALPYIWLANRCGSCSECSSPSMDIESAEKEHRNRL